RINQRIDEQIGRGCSGGDGWVGDQAHPGNGSLETRNRSRPHSGRHERAEHFRSMVEPELALSTDRPESEVGHQGGASLLTSPADRRRGHGPNSGKPGKGPQFQGGPWASMMALPARSRKTGLAVRRPSSRDRPERVAEASLT